jgi:hypothetical protein
VAVGILVGLAGLAAAAVALISHTGGEARPTLPPTWQKGMNFTAYQPDSYAAPAAQASLQALRATGADAVTVIPVWYMDSPSSSSVAPDPTRTASDASLLDIIQRAQALGMTVAMAPHVDVKDGSFRGHIAPDSIDEWFASYRGMIDHYAEIAQQGSADLFSVGTELESMSPDTDQFRAVIAEARQRFSGSLTYGANWVDEAERIQFWDDLDLIGIDAYMPLHTPDREPTVPQLVDAWQSYVPRITALHDRWELPVLFTECGYLSQVGAAAGEKDGAVSQRAQADAYEAAYKTWSGVPWFDGIYWWDWSAEGLNSQTSDDSFRPAGKLAEQVMRRWNGA